MESLRALATPELQQRWLLPLLEGKSRSAMTMTEPRFACRDATNIEYSIVRAGDHFLLNDRRWWVPEATRAKSC
ncbi:hypothetical protein [Aeromicrobium sp.]|uniref:hypothetical protein n=1 Tax=Aeromicrobium sp. TaxID=1871063 RepID=UPI0019A06DC0|nr:hypothetical protein [Aeromicrobium sp.]MBC7632689.1 hypothetical protein [Aeromicrobium sp.]